MATAAFLLFGLTSYSLRQIKIPGKPLKKPDAKEDIDRQKPTLTVVNTPSCYIE